ncbi:hypothetical protein SBRCBS47491_002590 [Sporothrix bragantina]|uniref:Uncharacterized protein n=1 Tax=Sporothrix bragantina TaxID=671064 RepID=A0ABP0B969_9PEZI
MFGLADSIFEYGHWSVAEERDLRNQWFAVSTDFSRFSEVQRQMYEQPEIKDSKSGNLNNPLEAELWLWDILQHRYRCGLNDLFRYGLRPCIKKKDACETGRTFAQYCAKLTAILVHPLWGTSSLAHVRYLLQRIVQERVPGHIKPLIPPYSYDRPPFVDTARHWGYETSMRMTLYDDEPLERDNEETTTVASGHGDAPGKGSASARLKNALHEAAKASSEAEAEMAQFLFHSSAPRDYWWLDKEIKPLQEPGSEAMEEDSGEEDSNESGSGEDSPNPYGLKVDESFYHGGFKFADSYLHLDEEQRRENRREEDRLANRKKDGEQHEETTRKGKIDSQEDNFRDDQVFFDLRVQDLDQLLGLMSHRKFLYKGNFRTPDCYLMGYTRAHTIFGYGGEKEKGDSEEGDLAPKPPLLTCMQCAQKYHQYRRDTTFMEDDDSDDDDENDNDDHDHDHDNDHGQDYYHDHAYDHQDHKPDHDHIIDQNFVRDVGPDREVEWLTRRKCEWLLSGCRERIIREALEYENNEETEGNSKQISLPDIPPFDPPPLVRFDRTFTHPTQLAVLERMHGRPHASELWCFDGLVEEDEGKK